MSSEKNTVLLRECAIAEAIWRTIIRRKESQGDEISLEESPINPWIVDQAELVVFHTLQKSSLFMGSCEGSGIIFARLPQQHETLIRWSAPLFIKIKMNSYGFSFGKMNAQTFAVCSSPNAKEIFTSAKRRSIKGMDFNFSLGTSIRESSDVVSLNFAPELGYLGISSVNGTFLDLSFFVNGAIAVDEEKCRQVYGDGKDGQDSSWSPAVILATRGPSEFNPIYGELSRVVATVEHPKFTVARMSASLERFSTGRDPDREMVLPDGVVVRQDLNEPPIEEQ